MSENSLFEDDLILPGVITEILSDYSQGYDTSLWGTTDSAIVIGTAFDGPVGDPVKIFSPEYGAYIYGNTYDPKTKKEASLMKGINDLWSRGCRTIYGCRISGKEIYKDYSLAADTNLKLRVKGIFPSNRNKNLSFVLSDDNELSLTIYKPADRATITEKNIGAVDSMNSVITNVIDLYGNGIEADTELSELIRVVNKYSYNNVLILSIVDEKGNDVTLSSDEAKSLKVADLYPGLYTIGRASNKKGVIADTKLNVIFTDEQNLPYPGYQGLYYKKLHLNTNVAKDLPIYSENHDLNVILGTQTINELDFLTVLNKIDDYFEKDSIDYEEVDLSNYEIYERLGKGYAINSQVTVDEKMEGRVKRLKVKVREVTDKDTKRSELSDGIYSKLENVPCKYRVLTGVNADTKIKGSLPKPSKFKCAKVENVKMLNKSIQISPAIKEDDLTASKNYTINFLSLTEEEIEKLEEARESLYTEDTLREASVLKFEDLNKKDENRKIIAYKEGSIFLVKDAIIDGFDDPVALLYTFSNGKFQCLHEFKSEENKDIMENTLVLAEGEIYKCSKSIENSNNPNTSMTVFEKVGADAIDNMDFVTICLDNGSFIIGKVTKIPELKVEPYGTIEQVLSNEEDKLLTGLCSAYGNNVLNIKSNQFDFLTIDEIVDLLKQNTDFCKLFNIKVIDEAKAQQSIDDIKDLPSADLSKSFEDKKIGYNASLLIPFRTDDNFARHLAQHCYYTSLKTSPTHGFIGITPLLDTSPGSIANRVKELCSMNLVNSLVAKKGTGKNMLDRNNMPYPIGRKVSVIVTQYSETDNTGYSSISNGAAGYAGMVSCLSLEQSSTNQPISIPKLSYEFTSFQLEQLTSAGFVTIKNSYTKGWVVTDGITMAPLESEFRRLSASRIADKIEQLIREASEPFIGQQNNLANRNSLTTSIKSNLEQIKGKLIESYQFKLDLDKQISQLGTINITYAFVPIYEIKKINNRISISH